MGPDGSSREEYAIEDEGLGGRRAIEKGHPRRSRR